MFRDNLTERGQRAPLFIAMGNAITELASYMQEPCIRFLAQAKDAGIECELIGTGRTPSEQVMKVAQGVSWTTNSRHEPQPPEGKSEAFDVCPIALLKTKFWSPTSPLWAKLGEIGEGLGLEWGGRWQHHPDVGHFQWKRVSDQAPGLAADITT